MNQKEQIKAIKEQAKEAPKDACDLIDRMELIARDMRAERYLLEREYAKLVKRMSVDVAILALSIVFCVVSVALFVGAL